MRRLLRTHPEVFEFAPVAVSPLMVLASIAYAAWGHHSSWAVYTVPAVGIALVLWHVALFARKPSWALFLYAAGNLLMYAATAIYCLLLVVGDAL